MGVERARIARDMHDELGASLTKIKLLSDLAETGEDLPPATREQIQKISSTAQGVSRDMDEIVWTVTPENDTLDRLVDYITNFAEEFLRLANLRLRFKVSSNLPDLKLVSETRHEVFMVVKEALNNVAKHAQASEVTLGIAFEDGLLRVAIVDDGRGFEKEGTDHQRNGLNNMAARIEKLHGHLDIQSKPGGGTTICFAVPVLVPNHPGGQT
jgi:signal transduction histidine kinase